MDYTIDRDHPVQCSHGPTRPTNSTMTSVSPPSCPGTPALNPQLEGDGLISGVRLGPWKIVLNISPVFSKVATSGLDETSSAIAD